jgi:hypothetical protein
MYCVFSKAKTNVLCCGISYESESESVRKQRLQRLWSVTDWPHTAETHETTLSRTVVVEAIQKTRKDNTIGKFAKISPLASIKSICAHQVYLAHK